MSQQVRRILSSTGTELSPSCPYTPCQNGTAEVTNRILVNLARTQLIDSGLPKSYWAEAINYTTYILNRMVQRESAKTPYELFYGKKPNIKNLRAFGEDCFVYNNDPAKRKFDDRGIQGRLVGFPEGVDGYRVLTPSNGAVRISKDVTFAKPGLFNNQETSIPHHQEELRSTTPSPENVPTEREESADHPKHHMRLRDRSKIKLPARFEADVTHLTKTKYHHKRFNRPLTPSTMRTGKKQWTTK
jgi:hypothetical protein